MIDSHCHLDRLDLGPYDGAVGGALDAARAAGVTGFLCINVDLAGAAAMRSTVGDHPDVWFAMGQHPEGVLEPVDPDRLDDCLAGPRVVAVGESGLDFHRLDGEDGGQRRRLQREAFAVHLQAGRRRGLPVVVHSRGATDAVVAGIREHGGSAAGVIHCFTEGRDAARRYLDLGYCLSISGIVTFRSADTLRDVVKYVPLDRLLIETDSPWLAPVPHRGRSNEPRFVSEVARCVAEVRDATVGEVIDRTTENFFRLFPAAV